MDAVYQKSGEIIMRIDNLSAGYGKTNVIQNLSLEISDTGITCFWAPSGCGKTTLLNILAGLKNDYTGTLQNDKIISAIFQEDRLIPQLSALDNVRIVLEKTFFHIAEEYLIELGLGESIHSIPSELSGGMKRRVAIARAFAYGNSHKECLFLMDEPLKGLDLELKEKVMIFIKKRIGVNPGILITHDPSEVLALSNKTINFFPNPMRIDYTNSL